MGTKKRARFINAERRQFPRVVISVPVVLTGARGQTVHALMHNVSPGGMQVRLGADASAALLPKRDEIGNSRVVFVLARFLLPLREERVAISVKCAVAHVSPVDGTLAAARIAIGFRFKRFKDTKNLRRFVLFLEEQLVPIEDYELYLHGHSPRQNRSSSKSNKKI
jgi:hypothetical protein